MEVHLVEVLQDALKILSRRVPVSVIFIITVKISKGITFNLFDLLHTAVSEAVNNRLASYYIPRELYTSDCGKDINSLNNVS